MALVYVSHPATGVAFSLFMSQPFQNHYCVFSGFVREKLQPVIILNNRVYYKLSRATAATDDGKHLLCHQ